MATAENKKMLATPAVNKKWYNKKNVTYIL